MSTSKRTSSHHKVGAIEGRTGYLGHLGSCSHLGVESTEVSHSLLGTAWYDHAAMSSSKTLTSCHHKVGAVEGRT